jgi:AraC-like DNA-binding protein
VSRRVGLSRRTFIRRFTDEVGLTPKLFWRIQRFQEALRLVRTGRRPAWADVALDCGYYDQAHFIRDFRAFSGLTPPAFLRAWGAHLEYGARWTG